MSLDNLFSKLKGGSGSGNFGHQGIPGHQGGSASGGGLGGIVLDAALTVVNLSAQKSNLQVLRDRYRPLSRSDDEKEAKEYGKKLDKIVLEDIPKLDSHISEAKNKLSKLSWESAGSGKYKTEGAELEMNRVKQGPFSKSELYKVKLTVEDDIEEYTGSKKEIKSFLNKLGIEND